MNDPTKELLPNRADAHAGADTGADGKILPNLS